jgi:hypothetical protein
MCSRPSSTRPAKTAMSDNSVARCLIRVDRFRCAQDQVTTVRGRKGSDPLRELGWEVPFIAALELQRIALRLPRVLDPRKSSESVARAVQQSGHLKELRLSRGPRVFPHPPLQIASGLDTLLAVGKHSPAARWLKEECRGQPEQPYEPYRGMFEVRNAE